MRSASSDAGWFVSVDSKSSKRGATAILVNLANIAAYVVARIVLVPLSGQASGEFHFKGRNSGPEYPPVNPDCAEVCASNGGRDGMREDNRLGGLLLAAVVATAAWSFTNMAAADTPQLMTESALIPSADPVIQLYL